MVKLVFLPVIRPSNNLWYKPLDARFMDNKFECIKIYALLNRKIRVLDVLYLASNRDSTTGES